MTTTAFSRPLRVVCWAAFVAGVLINLLVWFHPRGAALGNGHSFRQFQTALTAKYLVRDGFQLDYETPVLGPPWSIPMEFPLYQYTVAAVVRCTGAPLETAGRAVSMGYFWAGIGALWLLLRGWGIARETRLLTLALLLTCPVYLFYGRHFMIETTALSLGLWFLWAFAGVLRTGRLAFLVAAGLFATAAGLAKITTFFGFGVAAGLMLAAELRARPGEWGRLLAWSGTVLLPALALSWLWVRHADTLKAQNPIGDFLVSARLHDFNFGHVSQRFDPGVWQRIGATVQERIATQLLVAFAIVGIALAPRGRRWLAAGCAASFVAALVVFTNLFYVHDYYFEATAVFLLVAIALGLEGLLNHPAIPTMVRGLVVVLAVAGQAVAFWVEYGDQFKTPPAGSPALAGMLERLTDAEDVIVVVGQDWHASLPYFSNRRALMIPSGFEQNRAALQKSVKLLSERRVGALVVAGGFRDHARVVVALARIFGTTPRPLVEGDGAQIHLPLTRLAELPARLPAGDPAGFTVNRTYDPAKDILNAERDIDLTLPEWTGKFSMATPAPQRMTGIFPPSIADLKGSKVIGTHAPNSVYFQPPAGATRLTAVGGLFPGAYEGASHTDGVVVEVWESLPDGNQHLHFQRSLFPFERPADREELTIEIKSTRPFVGPLYLRVDPGLADSINYDWFYWRSVEIR